MVWLSRLSCLYVWCMASAPRAALAAVPLFSADYHPNPVAVVAVERLTVAPLDGDGASSKISLSATPAAFNHSGAWATVRWSGVPDPDAGDFVGLWGAGDDLSATSPIKFVFCNASAGYAATGAGAWRFQLTNTRTDLVFGLLRGGPSAPVLAGTSNAVSMENVIT